MGGWVSKPVPGGRSIPDGMDKFGAGEMDLQTGAAPPFAPSRGQAYAEEKLGLAIYRRGNLTCDRKTKGLRDKFFLPRVGRWNH